MAVLGADMNLFREIAVLQHPRELREPSQRHLAPLPAYFRSAQRVYKRARLLLQRLLSKRNRFERALQTSEAFGALLLDAQHLLARSC